MERNLSELQREQAASIIEYVGRKYAVAEAELIARTRGRHRIERLHVAQARQVAMYVLREGFGWTLVDIGLALGGRDHGTVWHGVERVGVRLRMDVELVGIVRGARLAGQSGERGMAGVLAAARVLDIALGELSRPLEREAQVEVLGAIGAAGVALERACAAAARSQPITRVRPRLVARQESA